jgi:hypothetical protein
MASGVSAATSASAACTLHSDMPILSAASAVNRRELSRKPCDSSSGFPFRDFGAAPWRVSGYSSS